MLTGKELNRANLIVIDPRMTRTAAHATEYVRIRSGTDIPVIWGMLWHIFENGWEDKEFIKQRVYGMDEVRAEVKKWDPKTVEDVTGVPGEQLKRVAEMFAKQKPSTLIWCMGATQHTVGTANVRAYCILLLATGNVGAPGTGANIFRGHTNVQGATDLGLDVVTLPLYYGLDDGAWAHWARVWEVDLDVARRPLRQEARPQQHHHQLPHHAGHPVDALVRCGVAAEGPGRPEGHLEGGDHLRPRRQHRAAHAGDDQGPGQARSAGHRRSASDQLRLARRPQGGHLPAADLRPAWSATARARRPTARCSGARRWSSRSSRARPTTGRSTSWPSGSAIADRMFKNIKLVKGKFGDEPEAESILREINKGGFSTGYCGQSPERLKAHMKHQDKFDIVTLRAKPDAPASQGRLLRSAVALLGHARAEASGLGRSSTTPRSP